MFASSYDVAMKHVNPARKSEQDAARASTPRVGWSVALMWLALAIPYAAVSWIYGARPFIEAYAHSAFRRQHLWDIAEFAAGYALIALAALTCAVAAARRLRCNAEYRMDKMWLLAAVVGTLGFPITMLMPDEMRIGVGVGSTIFSWHFLAKAVEILALMFLLGLICLPFTREAREGS